MKLANIRLLYHFFAAFLVVFFTDFLAGDFAPAFFAGFLAAVFFRLAAFLAGDVAFLGLEAFLGDFTAFLAAGFFVATGFFAFLAAGFLAGFFLTTFGNSPRKQHITIK